MNLISENYLIHHGVKGQKWGVRRQQRDQRKLLKKTTKYLSQLERASRMNSSSANWDYRHAKGKLVKADNAYAKKYGENSVSYGAAGKTKEGKAYLDVKFKNTGNIRVTSSGFNKTALKGKKYIG